MDTEAFIPHLILQDLKHAQLVDGLQRLGFVTEMHSLRIWEVVARLMGKEPGEVEDEWLEKYLGFLDRASEFPITEMGRELGELAAECYKELEILNFK